MSFLRQFVSLNKWTKFFVGFLFVWSIAAFLFATKLNSPVSNSNNLELQSKRINRAIAYIDQSRQQNDKLRELLDQFIRDTPNELLTRNDFLKNLQSALQTPTFALNVVEPKLEYELMRRRVETNIGEFWNLVHSELNKIDKNEPSSATIQRSIGELQELAAEHKRSLLNDIEHMKTVDGYEAWRKQEVKDLSDLVQKRLNYLQNPSECNKARKLICRLNKGCGYGCQLHHVVYCFIMAYATERTLILKSKGWRYHKGGWEEVFQPVSNTCLSENGASSGNWPGSYDTQVLNLPIVDSLNPRPQFLPLSVPADLAPRLMKIHGDPIVWWVGQFLKFLLRPHPNTEEMLKIGIEKLGFQRPIVGVHIRRTDKVGTEANYHGIEEYMSAVEEYYNQLEMKHPVDVRRVFIASDEPKVIADARRLYPKYEIIGDPEIAKTAAVSSRYSDQSLNGIILDIHLLSLSDYLVCTFSSQVCRVAYEIMQSMHVDASKNFKSLDDIYYYGGQNPHNRESVLSHKPRNSNEIRIDAGDLIGIAGNHWNGYSMGQNRRTNQNGLFPSFKVNEKVATADFPKYENVV